MSNVNTQKLQGKINTSPHMSGSIKLNMVYPPLEDLEVIPSGVEQNFKSSKYGFDNVKVRAVEGISEDLAAELSEQDNLLTTQEVTIEDIIIALEGKSTGGGGITPKIEGNTLILSGANVEGGVLSI